MDVNTANKTIPGILRRLVPPTPHGRENREGKAASGHTSEANHDDLDERFREAIQRGDTNGDVVFLDEQGNEIKVALSSKTIFDF